VLVGTFVRANVQRSISGGPRVVRSDLATPRNRAEYNLCGTLPAAPKGLRSTSYRRAFLFKPHKCNPFFIPPSPFQFRKKCPPPSATSPEYGSPISTSRPRASAEYGTYGAKASISGNAYAVVSCSYFPLSAPAHIPRPDQSSVHTQVHI
jgi:hypothetical protein